MVNTRGTHKRRRLPAAVYLCYLLVAVLAFTGASVAGYKTEATTANSAHVAQFNIEAAPVDVDQNAAFTLNAENNTGSYSFTVTNGSGGTVTETAVSYDVVVKVPGGMPNGVTVSLTNAAGADVSRKTGETGSTEYTFPNAGIFEAANPAEQTLTLTFTAGSGASSGSVSGISVDVVATQID